MKCEYCDTVFKDGTVKGVCPNCGGILPEKSHQTAQAGPMPDEKRRKKLKESGCRYCPRCLSINVTKGRIFPNVGTILFFIVVCYFSLQLIALGILALMIPVVVLLILAMNASFLDCKDCKLHWIPAQAEVYEKYRFQLHRILGDQKAVQCPGINQQSITMSMDTVIVAHANKKRTANYRNIRQVSHREPAGDLFGYLTIRDVSNRNLPIPQSYEEAQNDPMTILYEPEYLPHYRAIYQCLREIAEINT